MKEKAELILNGGEKSISSILPMVDDFERALKKDVYKRQLLHNENIYPHPPVSKQKEKVKRLTKQTAFLRKQEVRFLYYRIDPRLVWQGPDYKSTQMKQISESEMLHRAAAYCSASERCIQDRCV